MTNLEERIHQLEAEVEHLKKVAVCMMSGLCLHIAHTPEGLRQLADRWPVLAWILTR